MVHSDFQNFYFWNHFVNEMLGATYGLSRELCVGFFVWYVQKLDFLDYVPIISEAKHGRIYGQEWLMCVIAIN